MSYRVLRRLAAGGFSEILEIEDPASALAERLILKRLNAEMSAKGAVRAAFAEEAKILRDLKHPNVVTFRRCFIDARGQICLVMEKVEGEPLDRWARLHAARPEAILDLYDRVLLAVDYLHHRPNPYLHLDLKPENILVIAGGGEPQPVLIDFGIARRSGGSGLKAYTPPYGAPEQRDGKPLDCATDVYALGQILAELIAIADPGEAHRERLLVVVRRATEVLRRRRFADAGELRLALRQARRETADPAVRGRHPVGGRELPRRRLAALVGALVVGLAGAAAVLVPRGSPVARESPAALTGAEMEARFNQLVTAARRATYDRRFETAEELYEEARNILAAFPGRPGRGLEQELDALRSQIDIVRTGGLQGERVRLDLD